MRGTRSNTRRLVLALTVGGAGAALIVQRRHLGAIARDPQYAELTRDRHGRSIEVRSADGTPLHAEAFNPDGTGPLVVLAHGWTERLTIWGPVIDRLSAAGVRTVAYDLRGHGRSGLAAGGDYSLPRFGEDVEAVLSAVNLAAIPTVIVGHSLGAMAVAAWAADHPVGERVQAAALVNTGLVDLLTGHLLFGEVASRFNSRLAGRMFMGVSAPLPAVSSPVAHAAIRHVAFGPSADLAQIAFYERMLLETPPRVRGACGDAMAAMDLLDAAGRLEVPTLVVAGDRDRLTPPAHARRIAERLPHSAGVVVLEDTGHMSPLERPRELADELLKLLATLPSTRPRTALTK
jgi:pimeloyl-ACP methyl ester carboxylesterase